MSSSNMFAWDENIIERNHNDQVGILASELLNSNIPTRQLPQVQAMVNIHENLQPNLQTLVNTDPLVERINNHSQADIDTFVDSVDSMRSLGRICRSLQRESLSVETVEVINTEGGSVINNLINICSRNAREIQQNALVLQQAIEQNERTTNDPLTNDLLQQQLKITATISTDPREAHRQIKQVITINDQLQHQIEQVEPDVNAGVRIAAEQNSKYLKYAARVCFFGAAAVTMCVGIAYSTPVVISTLTAASTAAAATEAVPIIQYALIASKTIAKVKLM